MNTDIRLSTGFWQHPKTRKLSRRLGLEGVRSLQILWAWTAQNRPDGDLSGMDWEDIELAADWQGDERAFFDYCLGTWIDENPGGDGYVVHDWKEHNSWAAEADARSESSRFSRMAKFYPDEYKTLVQAGVKGISSADYAALKNVRERPDVVQRLVNEYSTTVERPLNDGATTVERPSTDASSPAPAPAPAPAPSPAPMAIKDSPHTPLTGGNDAAGDDSASAGNKQRRNECENAAEKDQSGKKRKEKKQSGPGENSLPSLRAYMESYTENPGLRAALEDFRVMRERMRRPLTRRALVLTCDKLDRLAGDNERMKAAILDQSVQRGWQGVFELGDVCPQSVDAGRTSVNGCTLPAN